MGFDQCRSMGEAASSTAQSNYKNTIVNMKRLVGLSYDDPRAQAEMKKVAYTCVPYKRLGGGPDSIAVRISVGGERKDVPIESVAGIFWESKNKIETRTISMTNVLYYVKT